MIAPAVTAREQIAKALEQTGEIGLKVHELVTVTRLSKYVVLYTLRNMKTAGQVSIAEGGEPYQRDRLWVLNAERQKKKPGRPVTEAAPVTDASNREFARRLSAIHPHGYEDARLLPKARLDATGVTR